MPTVNRSLSRTVLAFAIGILVVTLHNPSYGKARKHEVLDPIGQWEVISDRIQCIATRAFGDPKAPTTLIVRKNGLEPDFYMDISGRIAKLTAWDEEGALSFGSQFGEHIISYDSGRFGRKHSLKFNSGLRIDKKASVYFEEDGQSYADWLAHNTALEREAQRQVKSISIRNAGRWDIDLNSGSLADMFLLLDNCMQKMIANMGLNIAEQKQLKWRPRANVQKRWLSPLLAYNYDYEYASVIYRVIVDKSGRARDCITEPGKLARNFYKDVCREILQNSRFTPAIGKDGKALESYYISMARFFVS